MKKIAIVAAMLACQGAVLAAEDVKVNFYGEVSLGQLQYKDPGFDFSPAFVRVLAGKNFNNHFAVEGLLGASLSNNKKTISSVELTTELPYLLGVYGKVFTNPNEDLEIFARLGSGNFKRTFSTSKISLSETGSNFSYGVGAKYAINKAISATADYMTYYQTKNSVGLSGFSIGVGYNF